MIDIERAIEIQQMSIKKWKNRINDLEEIIKKHPWGSDGLKYDADDWREFELKRRKEQIKISLTTISALEKQIPIKPCINNDALITKYNCPVCGRIFWEKAFIDNHCSSCGQRLDGSVEE